MSPELITTFLERERLPPAYRQIITDHLLPLSHMFSAMAAEKTGPLIIGINGAQGTGKSTLAGIMKLLLQENENRQAVVLSLDDFYLTRAERQQLSRQVHPLLATRGVPGTHDIALALQVITDLATASPEQPVHIPRFNKARDDRHAAEQFEQITRTVDIILLEGWCIGVQPQGDTALATPVNALEQNQDADGSWRRQVNAQLAGVYRQLFMQLDFLLMLKAPSFEIVHEWRCLQEQKLAASLADSNQDASAVMTPEQISEFIAHYERLTRHALDTLPKQADLVLYLDYNHDIIGCQPPACSLKTERSH